MELLNQLSSSGQLGASGLALEQAILGLLLAFVLGQLAAWIYMYTHAGLSYSRAFVQSIILLTIIICLGMMVIGNNIVIAFGLIGALAVVRFRNILKDTRDMAFVFFALVVGMATGTGSHHLAVLGTALFCLVLLYLHWAQFGSLRTGDGFVRFQMDASTVDPETIQAILHRYCRSANLVSQRFHDEGYGETSYRLIMRDPERADNMVEALRQTPGLSNITFVLQEEQAEV
jgi:uncharacterized membrane protein YhiD involved in acid resistance